MQGLYKIGHNSRKKLTKRNKKTTKKPSKIRQNQADFDDLRNLKIGRKKAYLTVCHVHLFDTSPTRKVASNEMHLAIKIAIIFAVNFGSTVV